MPHHHCRDFSRSELIRRAAAEAGNGLPRIEPGTPLPAGTGLSRRSLLLRSAAVGLSVYGASRLGLGALEEGVAEAAAGPAKPVLVSVFLEGGIDSLSVLAPTGDPRYANLRPGLGLGEGEGSPFAEDDRLRWHPSVAPLATLHGEGKLTVFPAIGYTDPDQSHFTSRHFGRSARCRPRSAPAGWAATSTASAMPATRCRAWRWTGAWRRRSQRARCRWRRSTGLRTSFGAPASGARSRRR